MVNTFTYYKSMLNRPASNMFYFLWEKMLPKETVIASQYVMLIWIPDAVFQFNEFSI